VPARSQFRVRRLWTGSIGVAGTLLLHALLVLPLFLDLSLPAHEPPNRSGAGASAFVSNAEPVMTVVFINEPSTAERKAPADPELLASRGLAPVDLPVVVLSPDVLPAADAADQDKEQDSSAPPEAAGDQAQHAILYGRYLGQVQARIERAWMRPRTEIGAPRFSCRVRIEQNRLGDVISVSLDHCEGGERWQQSLVSAIRTASPLPAPPDPSVYADRLHLTFQSEGFRPGAPAEEFEPERPVVLTAQDSYQERQSLGKFFEHSGRAPRGKDDSNVIHLTIIGSPRAQQHTLAPVSPRATESVPNAGPVTPSPQ
jgi:hypothetical protein